MTHRTTHRTTTLAALGLAAAFALTACGNEVASRDAVTSDPATAAPTAPAPDAALLPLTPAQAETVRLHNVHTGIPRVTASNVDALMTQTPGRFARTAE
jgi:hypothetical protein